MIIFSWRVLHCVFHCGGERRLLSLFFAGLLFKIISYLGKSKIIEKLQVGLHIMARALMGQPVRVLPIHKGTYVWA